MKIHHKKHDDTYVFDNGKERTHFLFLLSDLSAFGNPVKKPMGIRGNYRKCMKVLLKNELNQLELILKSGDYFEISSPVFSRGHTEEEVKEYRSSAHGDSIKVEPAKLSVTLKIPQGEAIKIYSIEASFQVYLVNQGGIFYESNDFVAVEEATGVYF
ncbi:hypothetical protein IJF91_02950 [Candidatus Saccharibacteria bacterium]|nr:hypothetical protein [Candidatus Saccharibacteria bacterium]